MTLEYLLSTILYNSSILYSLKFLWIIPFFFFSKTNALYILLDRSRGKTKPRKIRKIRRSSTLYTQELLFKYYVRPNLTCVVLLCKLYFALWLLVFKFIFRFTNRRTQCVLPFLHTGFWTNPIIVLYMHWCSV